MLSLTDLRYFKVAATSSSFRQASRALLITQPGLTHVVQRIEAEVGHALFERRRSGVRLTGAGIRLLGQVDALIEQWESLGRDVSLADRQLRGRVTLGCHPSVAQYTLGHVLPTLLRQHTQLQVRLFHDLSRHVTDRVNDGTVDIGIVVNPFAFPDLVIRPICTDEVTFWARPKAVDGVLVCDPGLIQTQSLLRTKQRFTRVIESSSLDVILSLAEAGVGTAILPTRVALRAKAKLKRVSTASYADRVCVVYRPQCVKSHLGRTVVDSVETSLRERPRPQ